MHWNGKEWKCRSGDALIKIEMKCPRCRAAKKVLSQVNLWDSLELF